MNRKRLFQLIEQTAKDGAKLLDLSEPLAETHVTTLHSLYIV